MYRILLILLGGGIGAVMRYLLSTLVLQYSGPTFPMGTLVVNLTGALMIGFLGGVFDRAVVPPDLRSFLQVGILGGYTTFSSFSLETFQLLRNGEIGLGAINILVSNVGGLVLVFIGFTAAQFVINQIAR